MAIPTLIVIIVSVNRIERAVLEVSSFLQQRYEEMQGVNAPKVQMEPKTMRVSVLAQRDMIASLPIFILSFFQQLLQKQMFRKLQNLEKNNYNNKNKQTYSQKSAQRNKMKEASYSRLHKIKKVAPSALLEFHVVSNDQYVYQGQWLGEFKNGEGIAFVKNGCLIVGHWQKDLLHGRSLIFTPFGSIISAYFINGKLNGWVLAQYRDKIVLANLYFEDKADGPRIMYEGTQQFWMASQFNIHGQLMKMSHVQKGTRNQLPLFVQNDQLFQLFDEIITKKNYSFGFNTIKTIQVSPHTHYIGFTDTQYLPSGLGATYSETQCFVGLYHEGFLEQIGRMVFANGDIYHGGLSCGEFLGHGIYYNPTKNNTLVIVSSPSEETQILQQQSGYFLVDFEIKIGQKISKQDKITFSLTLHGLFKVLQKYYHQYYIQSRQREENDYSNISQKSSQNIRMKDVEEESGKKPPAFNIVKWIPENENQDAISQEVSVDQNNEIKLSFNPKGFYSPKQKVQNQFNSITIKQNQNPDQRQKFNKQNPKESEYKKQFFKKDTLNQGLQASKSLDINQLTFRGTSSRANQNSKNTDHKLPKDGQPQYLDLQQGERNNFAYTYDQAYSEQNSSKISHPEQKIMGMMKKTNFRRKIFE